MGLGNITEAKWYKSMMPKLYGWGASLVIIGALFKIENWPICWGNPKPCLVMENSDW